MPALVEPSTAPPNEIAREVLAAFDGRHQIAPLSGGNPAFDLTAAYRVTAAVRRLREDRGERVVGRKIGFTNTTIRAEYGVAAPIWGYVYDTTLHWLADLRAPFSLAAMAEPRIEPEIAFGISLLRDGVVADEGHATNVLGGGPLAALRHLVGVLAGDPESPPLAPGEIVTTGTLTRALPIAPGETWSTALSGLPLSGIRVDFG